MSFPHYPKYKPSGVEWLGDVPEGWIVAPFKREIARNDGGVWGDDPDGISDTIVLRSTEQTVDGRWQLDNPASRKLTASEIDGALLAEGDLLLTKSSGSSLHIGKTTLVTAEVGAMRCCYSNFMQRIRMKKTFLPKLAWYVLNNELARQQLDLLSNTTTGLANLNATMIGQVVVLVPPLPEQTAVAEFLDRETGKIDELVAEQRQLMELLKEKRQAVISHAVTKGLNPHAPMKPSGIEWLGDVPVGWTYGRLRYFTELIVDGTHHSPQSLPGGDYLYITAKNIKEHGFDLSEITYVNELQHREIFTRCPVQKGDVLYIKDGATAGIAMVNPLVEEFSLLSSVALIRAIRTKLIPEFIAYQLNASQFKNPALNGLVGGAMTRFTLELISRFEVSLPPIDEQRAIVAQLDIDTAKFDTLTAEAQRAIDLLQERRTALISAAVTGQIDVRQHQKN